MTLSTIYTRYDKPCLLAPEPQFAVWKTVSTPYIEISVGEYFIQKWRDRVADAGAFHTARQMRKQGIPLGIALLTLFGIEERLNQETK